MSGNIFDVGGIDIFGKYQKGVTLDVCIGKGTWTASGIWTLPAFTAGNIDLGANRLYWGTIYLYPDSGTIMASVAIGGSYFRFSGGATALYERGAGLCGVTTGFASENVDLATLLFDVRETGVGLAEVARLVGAADPYFGMGGSQQFKFYNSGVCDLNGNIQIETGSTLQKAMSGDIVLECSPATAGSSAATLNAAAAGGFTKVITINLKDAAGNLHRWANLAVNAVTSEVVVDVDVAAPTVSDATPNIAKGTVDVTLTYDTDAGATKVYAVGDTVTLTISQPTGGILGYPISDATFVDTIVA